MNEAQRELNVINEDTPGWLPLPDGGVCFLMQQKDGGWMFTFDPNNLGNKLYRERIAELRARGLE